MPTEPVTMPTEPVTMPTEPADPAADAISQIEGIAKDADATAITGGVLFYGAGVTGYKPEKLAAYQLAISKAADGDLDTLAKIQATIDGVNGT
jgi:hypothetical protein